MTLGVRRGPEIFFMRRLFSTFALLFFVSISTGQTVTVTPLGESPFKGDLARISDGSAHFRTLDGATRSIPLARIVSLVFASPAKAPVLPDPKQRVHVELVGEGRLIASLIGGDDLVLTFTSPMLGERALPIDALRAFNYPIRTAGIEGIRPAKGKDVVFIGKSGDRLTGLLTEFERGALRFECDIAPDYRVPFDRIASLILDAESPEATDSLVASVRLHDGSSFLGTDLQLRGGALSVHPNYPGFEAADRWSLPLSALTHVTFRNADYVHLSDLSPTWEVAVVPFFPSADPKLDPNVWLAPKRDRSWKGGALTLEGHRFQKGVGAVSGTTITIPLKGAYASFQARVGVDDNAGPHGSVTFEVLVDGASKWKSRLMKTGDKSMLVPKIALSGAKSLSLRVGYGDAAGADVQDFANWVDALLIKKD